MIARRADQDPDEPECRQHRGLCAEDPAARQPRPHHRPDDEGSEHRARADHEAPVPAARTEAEEEDVARLERAEHLPEVEERERVERSGGRCQPTRNAR